jgi:hypothetical protein
MTRSGMSTMITDTEMSSEATPHTATAWPVSGEPTLWSVTWLPGRALTRDQAITAMTIAEMVTTHADAQNGTECWRPTLESWAAELGLTSDEAAKMASAPPPRSEDKTRNPAKPSPARTNEISSPCPQQSWTEHVTQDRTIHAHISEMLAAEVEAPNEQSPSIQAELDREADL